MAIVAIMLSLAVAGMSRGSAFVLAGISANAPQLEYSTDRHLCEAPR